MWQGREGGVAGEGGRCGRGGREVWQGREGGVAGEGGRCGRGGREVWQGREVCGGHILSESWGGRSVRLCSQRILID